MARGLACMVIWERWCILLLFVTSSHAKYEHWSEALVKTAYSLPPWQPYNYTKADSRYAEAVKKLKESNYVTPRPILLNGVSYIGAATRLRLFLKKLVKGEAVTIGAIGGSITHRTTGGKSDSYVDLFFNWVKETFPNPNHVVRNGAVPGTTSSYLSACLEAHLADDVDFVVLELAVNDHHEPDKNFETPRRHAVERLIRKLLKMPKQPAVIMLNMYAYCKVSPCGRFYHNAERDFGELALYYSLPSLSLKAGVFHVQDALVKANNSEDHYSLPLFYDGSKVHPGKFGHHIANEMIMMLFFKVLRDMEAGDFNEDQEEGLAHSSLPRPMIDGNWEPEHSTCIVGDVFRLDTEKLMGAQPPGWNWTTEEHHTDKWGFISTQPGSRITVRVDSTVATTTNPSEDVMVQLCFLQSYEHMGKARIKCESGCSCKEGIYDGHTEQRTSLTHMYDALVTQSRECVLSVEVLSETSSGEHKVKLLGAVVSEEAGEMQGPVLNGFARVDSTSFSIPPRPPPRPPRVPSGR